MNTQYAIAAALALVAAAIHGGVGEALVVSKLRHEVLSPTRFGGAVMTKLMIRVTWHITTLAFVVIGSALAVCSPAGPSNACVAAGRVASVSFASFFALAGGLAIAAQGRRVGKGMLRHPGPLVFALVAGLAWWGSIS
jgi:hypothetical protein